MTTTFRRCLAALLAAWACLPGAAGAGQAEAFSEFVAARGGPPAEAGAWLAAPGDETRKWQTPTHLLVARKTARPGADKSPRVAQAMMHAAKMQARRQLLHELFAALPEIPFQDRAMAEETYLQALAEDLPGFRLPGVEFAAGGEGGAHWAVAAARPGEAAARIKANLDDPAFARLYCQNGFVRAKNAYRMQDYPHALRLLREAHRKGYANADAYVLLARVFAKLGQAGDAKAVAKEVLENLGGQLTPESAEELGDLFLELQCEPEAQQAYEIGIARLS